MHAPYENKCSSESTKEDNEAINNFINILLYECKKKKDGHKNIFISYMLY